jgi:DNA replication and repair protein RecF
VQLTDLWLTDFRCYAAAHLRLADGLTVIEGDNGQGKSSLLEAVAYLATLRSFRRVPTDALIRSGATSAIVRAQGSRDGRSVLVEAELTTTGRNRMQVNRQRLRRGRDLVDVLRVSVFSPDDLELVKGGPAQRRDLLDDTLAALSPADHQLRADLERVVRQRNTLLRQARGRLTDEIATTLDVWDAQLGTLGDLLARRRLDVLGQLTPLLTEAYADVAGAPTPVHLTYEPAWLTDGLGEALARGRTEDVRRQVTLVGPHRDDVGLVIGGLPARTHASQGEQRSLALGLRLATHRLVAATWGTSPILLLDDVFSELDARRADALVRALPPGQTLLSTAGVLPRGVEPGRVVRVAAGTLVSPEAPPG